MKKIASNKYEEPKMKSMKRKAPRLSRDTEFCNHIKDVGKKRDSYHLLVKLKRSEK